MRATLAGSYLFQLPVAWLLGVTARLGLPGVYAGFLALFAVRATVTWRAHARGGWRGLAAPEPVTGTDR